MGCGLAPEKLPRLKSQAKTHGGVKGPEPKQIQDKMTQQAGGGGRERQQPRKKKSHSGAGEESAAPNNAQQRHSERAGHNAVSEPTPVRREGKATRCSPCQRRVHTTRGSFARRRHTERSSEKGTTRWQGRRRRDILALRLLNANASHACLSVRRKVRTRRCASVAQSNPSSPVQQSE